MNGVKEATVQLGDDVTLSVAVVHGGKNTRDFLNTLKESGKHYDSSKLWHAQVVVSVVVVNHVLNYHKP